MKLYADREGHQMAEICQCALDAWKEKQRQRLVAWSNLTDAETGHTFDALIDSRTWTVEQRRQFSAAVQAARAFAEGRASFRWLVLTGPKGGGKSHMAQAVLNHRIAHREAGEPGRYIVAPRYLSEIKQCFDRGEGDGSLDVRRDTAEELRQRYIDVPLLVLDDLGAQHVTGWSQEEIYMLLNERNRAERETVICTNLKPPEIPSRIRDRMMDTRLSRVVTLDLPSWRTGEVW